MKKVLTIFLAAVLLFVSMGNGLVFLSFKIHQAEIARALCVNKNKPSMHCEGKCVLHQRLAENNDRQNQSSPFSQVEESIRLTFFCGQLFDLALPYPATIFKHTFRYAELVTQCFMFPSPDPPESVRALV